MRHRPAPRRFLPITLVAWMGALAGPGLAQAADVTPAAPPTASPSTSVEALLKLARASGCLGCHQIDRQPPMADEPDPEADDTMAPRPPVAPAWRDVATKYRHQPGALQRLTATVMGGSNPYSSHWKYDIAGLAMPPNRVVISEADARQLVGWILSLDDPK